MTPLSTSERAATPNASALRGSRNLEAVEDTEADSNHALGLERQSGELPRELSSFVGREHEISEVKRLLGDTRLLTLSGPGGCGKTRLALAVGFDVVEDFEDGVWWVGLDPLSDPTLVAQEVSQVLGVREVPGRSPTDALVEHLDHKRTLLVLDNCEHLIGACAELVDVLLRSCPNLKVLATSREALAVGGEVAWLVPPLSLPNPELHRSTVEELGRYEGIRLFCERARSLSSTFELSEENAPAVARLCRRLDGMPLAIELAAARTRVLSVEQILMRLEDSLKLLTGANRTAHERQRTLRGTLDWSYELLSEPERMLFARLSVFMGGWTLEAAEALGAGDAIEEEEVLDLLSRLVDKSLVVVKEANGESGLRYRMLEPVRQYGLGRLEESGEAEQVRDRHARYYLALAEEAEPDFREQEVWLGRLEREHANFRAALSWALDERDAQLEGRAEVGLRLAAVLAQGHFWSAYGMSEGRRWLEKALARSSTSPSSVRAKALKEAGWIATHQGDYEQAVALLEEGMALFRGLEDKPGVAASIFYLGHLAVHGGDLERARSLGREAEALLQELVDQQAIAQLLYFLGATALCEGDHDRGVALLEESLALNRELGDLRGTAICLTFLGVTALERGDAELAAALYAEDMRVLHGLRDKLGIAYGLRGISCVAALQGDAACAARLWGAAEAVGQAIGLHLSPFDHSHPDYEGLLATVRPRLDEASWEAARAEGKAMTPEEAIEYALREVQSLSPLSPTQQPTPPPVTKRASSNTQEAPVELDIFALGGARVEVAGRSLSPSDFGYAKPQELLFYLISHSPRTREQIGLALWPEASHSQLRGSFHEALRRLRKALGGAQWIVHENRRYSFNRSLEGHYFFDVEAFEEKLSEAREVKEDFAAEAISHLTEAIELYGGDFLEGFTAEGEWAQVRQEELRRSYQDALQDLGVLLFSEGCYSEAAQAYRKILAMDRYSEAAHRGLMRSEAALGERGRALWHYQSLVEQLGEELGSCPAAETVTLYEEVLRGEEV